MMMVLMIAANRADDDDDDGDNIEIEPEIELEVESEVDEDNDNIEDSALDIKSESMDIDTKEIEEVVEAETKEDEDEDEDDEDDLYGDLGGDDDLYGDLADDGDNTDTSTLVPPTGSSDITSIESVKNSSSTMRSLSTGDSNKKPGTTTVLATTFPYTLRDLSANRLRAFAKAQRGYDYAALYLQNLHELQSLFPNSTESN